ncbi:phosphotransferase [Microlunatus sp. GCM10028923]|uniref:phosphotransferase n=1 Tax=Microlunatus sp. GCM10028923 TaxID=3273400 RepID=UPI00361AF1B2
MKTLPDRPSMDHLRQQAKELFAGLRENQPDLTLSGAQTLLAKQYGYRDWPGLKAEVDRRRADVKTADPKLAAELAEVFGLGRPVGPMEALTFSWAGQVWALTTERGVWRLTEFLDYTPADNIEVEFRLVEAAVAAGVPAAEPVRDRSGRPLAEVDGRRWRAHRELGAGTEVAVPVDSETATGIGRIIGTLHGLRLPAPGPVHAWISCRADEALLRRQLERSRAAGAAWTEAFERALPGMLRLAATVVDDRDPAEEPILSHGSPGPGTFLRRNGGELVLTGWGHACAIPPSWEFGTALEHWGTEPSGGLNEATVGAMVSGYRKTSGAEPYLELGMFSGTVTGWLTWVESRVNVALGANDPKAADHAARELPGLLENPLTVEHLERVLAAAKRPTLVA